MAGDVPFLVSNLDWFRHVLPAHVVGLTLLASVGAVLYDLVRGAKWVKLAKGLAVSASVAVAVLAFVGHLPRQNADRAVTGLVVQREFCNKLTSLNRDVVYFLCWHSPEISFLTGKTFQKLDDYKKPSPDAPDPVVIFSEIERNCNPEGYLRRRHACQETVLTFGPYEACALRTR